MCPECGPDIDLLEGLGLEEAIEEEEEDENAFIDGEACENVVLPDDKEPEEERCAAESPETEIEEEEGGAENGIIVGLEDEDVKTITSLCFDFSCCI